MRNPETSVAGDFSLRYLLEVFFRRKRVFVMALILTPMLAVAISLLIKNEYMSSTTILLGKEEILNPLVRYETAVAMTDTNRLGSFQKIVYSRPLLEETIRKLGITKNIKDDLEMEAAVVSLRKNIHLPGLTNDSFQIACTARTPSLAKNMVETVSQLFIEKSLQGSRREAVAAVNLIRQQVDYYRQEIDKTEQALQQFRQDNLDVLGHADTLAGQLKEYRAKELEVQLNVPYQKTYQDMELKMSNLLATRQKSHPEVVKLQREMDSVARLMNDEKRQRIEEYQRLAAETRKKLAQVPVLEKEQARMQSELKLLQELNNTLSVKLEQARITSEVEIAQQANRFTIIDPPVVPMRPHKPNRVLFAIGGVVGGICIGLFLVFLLEFTDPRLIRANELLRQTRLRLVGVLPKLYNFGEVEPFRLFARTKSLFLRLLPGRLSEGLTGVAAHVSDGFATPFVQPLGEGVRRIFCAHRFVLPPKVPAGLAAFGARLERSHWEIRPEEDALDDYLERLRSIAITSRDVYTDPEGLLWLVISTRAGEGKTFLTANLGAVMAGDLKKPVLLVDANLRFPSLSKALQHPEAPGLADVLEGRVSLDEALVSLETPGLTLLPAGTATADPDVLYNAPAMADLLVALRERFSFTLVEAPEVLTSSGGQLLAPHSDGILFVARLFSAKRKAIETAIHRLPAEKIIGVVFNYFEYWIPDWLYRWV
jgi:uncharacterized protein involved in exopolysaccharide biosynthesis/Mrp family chromosome partitioning ATPase